MLLGDFNDVFDDLQAVLQKVDDALPDISNSSLDGEIAQTIENSQDEHGCLQPMQSPSILPHAVAFVDPKPKKSRRERRHDRKNSSSISGSGGGIHEFESAITSVSVPAIISSVCSAKDSALATSDAKSHVAVNEENAEDTECTSSVLHREYFSHVRRVNLENLSLVIGSNLPVYQVHLALISFCL